MIALTVEMFRNDVWKTLRDAEVAVLVAVDEYGRITVTVPVGHLQPPWRIMRDGQVLFERQR